VRRARLFGAGRAVHIAFACGATFAIGACDVMLGLNGDYRVRGDASGATTGIGGNLASNATSSASGDTITSSASSSASGTGGAPSCDPVITTPGCPTGTVRISGGRTTNSLDNVLVTLDDYCIQTREVTFREYLEIADTRPLCFDEPADLRCRGNDPFSLLSPDVFRRAENLDAPVHPADFCDAQAYCDARGLRLCTSDEWRAACANDDALDPWSGGTHTCAPEGEVQELDTSTSTCKGDMPPRDQIFDMVGNVAEHAFCRDAGGAACNDSSHNLVLGALTAISWLDNTTTQENCRTSIGSTYRDTIDVDVDGQGGAGSMPTATPQEARVGIRCCATPNE
jgi:hypothetical protein